MGRRTPTLVATCIAAVTTLGLAACGSSAPGDEEAPAEGGDAQTLTVWHYYSVDGQVEGLERMADLFEGAHPGVTVEHVYVPIDQLTSKLVTAAGSGSGPDVVVYGAGSTYTLAEAGAITPMNDWWDGYADKDMFPEGVIQRVGDDILGVQGFVNLLGLWYNQDILDQVGIEPPTTMDELEVAMATVKDAGMEGITLTGISGFESQWQGFPWFTSHGFSYGDAQVAPMADTFAMLQDWTAKGYLSKEASVWDQTIPFQRFTAGGVAFAENGNWQITSAKNDADFAYGVVPLPLSSDGGVLLGGEAQNIGAFSANPELAKEYLEETFFSVEGELILLDAFGSIPARADVSSDPRIKDDPILSVFADIVQLQGRPSPSPDVPSAHVQEVELLVGQYWSSAVAGAGSPDALAEDLLAQLTPLLEGD
jgi:ABC-type glycerol-3-phosphate transport system substrate-binding protein